MIKSNKKNMYLLILVAVSITVIAVSFAYFVAQSSSPANTDVNVGTEVSEKLIFTPGDAISINANQENFAEGDGSISDSTTSSATIIANSSKGSASGVYQVYLDVTANNFVYTVDANTPELILTVTDPNGNEVTTIDGLSYKTVIDASTGNTITGFDITTFKGLIRIKEDEAISTNNSNTGTTENWIIKVTFVNLATDQVLNEGKTLESNFILQEEKIVYLNEHVIDLHGGVDGTNNLYYTNNAEYRYSGASPNNYVWFNDELWRIIGVFDDASHGITDANLIKIIKEEPIGEYMFDNKDDNGGYGYNSWSDDDGGAELNQLLNGYYYNSSIAPDNLAGCNNTDYSGDQQGSCDFASTGLSKRSRDMTEEVTWYLGGYSSFYVTASMAYTAERGTVGSPAPGAHLTYTGNIGLVYMSDYGYAAESSVWSTALSGYNLVSIYQNDWLYNGERQWSMTPYPSDSAYVWRLSLDGGDYNDYSRNGNGARPVLYLNSEVMISGGMGSETEPFLLEN